MADAYPLDWPPGWARTASGRRTDARDRFKRGSGWQNRYYWTLADAQTEMFNELKLLGARSVVVYSNLKRRLDGGIRSGQRMPDDPGVAVFFELEGEAMVMARDAFIRVEENIRSMTLAIAGLRQVKRHGGGQMMKRAFTGFMALPPPDTAIEMPGPDPRRSDGAGDAGMTTLLVSTLDLIARSLGKKGRSGQASRLGALVDRLEHAALHADVDPLLLLRRGHMRHSNQRGTFAQILSRHIFDGRKVARFDRLCILKEERQGLNGIRDHIFKRVSRRKTPRHVRKVDAVSRVHILVNNANVNAHFVFSYIQPAWRAMLRAVPFGRSFFGCGTMTVLSPLRNLWCDPLIEISSKPSALSRLTILLLSRSMCIYIHIIAVAVKAKCVIKCAIFGGDCHA